MTDVMFAATPKDSVTVEYTASGKWAWSIKVVGTDPSEIGPKFSAYIEMMKGKLEEAKSAKNDGPISVGKRV